MNYLPIIGLEVHVELNTKSKMFCSCANNPNAGIPNSEICPVCMGHPGMLPVINEEAVRKVIKTGLALNCQIPEYSKFDRKNYFYPDLPKGYQISQLYQPLCKEGLLEIDERKIRIREVHLEEDTGKLIHFTRAIAKGQDEALASSPESADYSLVDFNRAGVPLMELVTEPDITSAKQARKFAEELQIILRYLDVSAADMEKGQLRVEANVSLTRTEKLGTKVEIKNLNSFRAVEKGIDYEIKRQTEVLESGKKVIQETRGWLDEAIASSRRVADTRVDDIRGATKSQREKEAAHDYRYFPEPDLSPLHISKELINEIKAEIPELPQQRRERFKKEYKLADKDIETFVFYKDLGEYFEKVMSELRNWVKEIEMKSKIERAEFLKLTKFCLNYIITDLQGLLKRTPHHFFEKSGGGLITPENFAEFVCLIYKGKISSKIAKLVLLEMFKTGADPSQIIKEKGLTQITDTSEIEKIIKEVIAKNSKAIADFKKGKQNAFQYLIGQIMAQSRGKASPQLTSKLLNQALTKNK